MSTASPRWHIEDPRPIAREAPYTFFLPDRGELEALAPGDHVKVLFQYDVDEIERWSAERMWIRIEAIRDGQITGLLDNEPHEPRAPLRLGTPLCASLDQVLAIDWAEPHRAPAVRPRREYWERCLVDTCVLEGEEPVEFIYRENPELTEDGDTWPDSGWRIRGRQGSCDDAEMDERTASYVALGAVLNHDDSWLPLIDAPSGSRFLRDFETGAYRPE